MSIPTVVTHSGDFHADDIFAVATLRIALGDIDVVRTREEEIIKDADYVVDVGGVYDADENRFDHHQKGGAGERENGLPYASFGLVWKKFGEQVAGSSEVAERIDKTFIQSIDAIDSGVEIATPIYSDIYPQSINSLVGILRPTWNEDSSDEVYDTRFLSLVDMAEKLLARLVRITSDYLEARKYVEQAYQGADDKRIVVLEEKYPWKEVLSSLPEPVYVVYPRGDTWGVRAVPVDPRTFKNRKDFPAEWAGKQGAELVGVTGVSDAVFCHNARFFTVSKSREGALELAQKALG